MNFYCSRQKVRTCRTLHSLSRTAEGRGNMKPELCLLVGVTLLVQAVSIVSGIPNKPPKPSVPQAIQNLTMLLEGLENSTDTILVQLTSLSAQTASSGGQLQTIVDLLIPTADAQNSQQDNLINTFTDQIKDLRHKMGQAIADTKEAIDLTMSTRQDTDELLDKLDNFTDIDTSQTLDIERLHMEVKEVANDTSQQVQSALDDLTTSLTSANNAVQGLMNQVNDQRCDYGSETLPEGNTTVFFAEPFKETPTVTLTVTGFAAAIVDQATSQTDGLGFDQYLIDVTTDSFTIRLVSLTGGVSELQKVYSNWVACQQ